MKQLGRFLVSVLLPAWMLGGLVVSPAVAQTMHNMTSDANAAPTAEAEKGKTVPRVLLENDKVRVFEVRYQPGDEHMSVPTSAYRVVRVLSGGTMMRTYADGTTLKIEHRTDEVKVNEPSKMHYVTRNIGETEVILYVVMLKAPS